MYLACTSDLLFIIKHKFPGSSCSSGLNDMWLTIIDPGGLQQQLGRSSAQLELETGMAVLYTDG